MYFISAALFIAMFLLVSEIGGTLHAYLDPGTGSIGLQIILGGIVAVLATARLYWMRIKSFVLRRREDEVRS